MKIIEQVQGHEIVNYAPATPAPISLWQSIGSALAKLATPTLGIVDGAAKIAATSYHQSAYEPPRLDAYYQPQAKTQARTKAQTHPKGCCCPCHRR